MCKGFDGYCYAQGQEILAEEGLLDLRSWDFKEHKTVELKGEWEFYYNDIIYYETFNSPDYTVKKEYRYFPKLWGGQHYGTELKAQGYATNRLRVIFNSITPELAISIPTFYTSYELFINGEHIASNGQVGASAETSIPHWTFVTKPLKIISDTLDIVLFISNFHHSKGGASVPIIIGEKVTLLTEEKRNEANDLIMAASLFFVGIFFMVRYGFDRQDKEILFYALFCLTLSYRAVGSDRFVLHTLLPNFNWLYAMRLEYISLFMSVGFFYLYSYNLYKKETSTILITLAFGICFFCSLFSLIAPPVTFSRLIFPFLLFILAGSLYLFYTYIVALKNNSEGAKLSVFSSFLFFLTIGLSILDYLQYIDNPSLIYLIGFQQFFFVQAVILFYRYNKKMKYAKERAELAMKSQSDFLYMISHEIRTPLNAVIGLTNYLITDNPKTAHKSDLNTLKFSAEHLHVLINDVLDYSKLDNGKIEFEKIDTDLITMIENIVSVFNAKAREKKIVLKLNIDETLPKNVVCDGLRLSQVLTNLISNAIKFTAKGEVKVTIEKALINNDKGDVYIKFIIEDTGIGIPKNKLDEIFESFTQASSSTTRKYGGTGLGLTISKKILDLQNVKLYVFSKENEGSRFYFTQKFQISGTKILAPKANYELNTDLKDKSVLLVEDNPINAIVLKKYLERWNISMELAENGKVAMEMVGQKQYDLIFMDLQMPIMDGYSAAMQMRINGVETPIIALTATVSLNVLEEIKQAGMDDMVTKPFDPNDLYQKLLSNLKK